jgi:tRNA(Arg) A34 adenosine deaminase TadA
MKTAQDYLGMAIDLAVRNVRDHGGQPFGTVLVKNGEVLAIGVNETGVTHDPSAHSEMQAIRTACRILKTPQLDGVVLYASGVPCPMCLAAIRLAGIREVYYAYSDEDAAPFDFSTVSMYAEMAAPFTLPDMTIKHQPVSTGENPYVVWGDRR